MYDSFFFLELELGFSAGEEQRSGECMISLPGVVATVQTGV